jgi:hypothetical protein
LCGGGTIDKTLITNHKIAESFDIDPAHSPIALNFVPALAIFSL